MKIALISDSLLLDHTLEMYLKEYLTSYKSCDFVVATKSMESADKPVFLISDDENAQLSKPFTKEILIQKLESFYTQISNPSTQEPPKTIKPLSDFLAPKAPKFQNTNTSLEAQIQELFKRYADELKELILQHKNG
ncbi:MAG: hypothetical protein J1E31_00885 [Helicobacter sp.]|nr:hypothetical protein [Helicobacter sp.]